MLGAGPPRDGIIRTSPGQECSKDKGALPGARRIFVCAVRFWSGTGRTSSECFRSRDLILYLDTERVSLYPAKRRCARSSMDRASDYGSEGWGFESLRARSGPPRCDPPAGALHFVKHPCGGAFSFPGVPFHGGMRRFQMKPESPRYWLPYGGLKPEPPRRAEKPSIVGVVAEQGRCGFQACGCAAVLGWCGFHVAVSVPAARPARGARPRLMPAAPACSSGAGKRRPARWAASPPTGRWAAPAGRRSPGRPRCRGRAERPTRPEIRR